MGHGCELFPQRWYISAFASHNEPTLIVSSPRIRNDDHNAVHRWQPRRCD